MATKKTNTGTNILTEGLNQRLRNSETLPGEEEKTEITTKETSKNTTSQVNFRMSSKELKEIKMFALENDISISELIRNSLLYVQDQKRRGNILISRYGIRNR